MMQNASNFIVSAGALQRSYRDFMVKVFILADLISTIDIMTGILEKYLYRNLFFRFTSPLTIELGKDLLHDLY